MRFRPARDGRSVVARARSRQRRRARPREGFPASWPSPRAHRLHRGELGVDLRLLREPARGLVVARLDPAARELELLAGERHLVRGALGGAGAERSADRSFGGCDLGARQRLHRASARKHRDRRRGQTNDDVGIHCVRLRCLRLNLAVLSSAARAPAIGRTPKWTRQIPESPTPAGRVRSARIEPMPDISAEVLTANVLIVDDEGADRRLMTAILEGAGYSHLASTGDPGDAARLHRENHYDLIILDLMMPGTDGFAVMRELREIERDGYLPVLAVTSDTDLMTRALGEGARDFIGKPLNRIEVLARVRNMLRERMLMNRLRERGRESESHFRALVEQSIVGIYMIDEGRFVYANPRMCEILGYPLEELLGFETMQLVVDEDRERLVENRPRGEGGD